MKTTILAVENIKCHGCANTVRKEFKRLPGVIDVDVDVSKGEVSVKYDAEENMDELFYEKLRKLGYPEQGKGNLGASVKSYVSCAIGRIGPDE